MPIKVIRKFVYIVEGKEYADQKEANEAAKAANVSEKRVMLAQLIEHASGPLEAAAAIMERFHVYNRHEDAGVPGVRKWPRKKKGMAYDVPLEMHNSGE